MTRKESREIAFSILFEAGFDPSCDILAHFDLAIRERDLADDPFARRLLCGVAEHLSEIDLTITKYSENWSRARISRVSLAILRLAGYEMLFLEEIPLRVSLNEAIELAKKYDDEGAYGFVNGVLNAMMHDEHAVGEK